MSKIIDGVWDICEQFLPEGRGENVSLCEEGMVSVAKDIKEKLSEVEDHWWGYPKCINQTALPEDDLNYMMLCYELIADSINYQYWYGRHDVRPNGACANRMYELFNEAIADVIERSYIPEAHSIMKESAKVLIEKISLERFPNLENRIRHINEIISLIGRDKQICDIYGMASNIACNTMSVNEFLSFVISNFPGYAEDMFLKRAFLLPIMLYRRVQWFKDEVEILPVPADYQIPKMLEGLACINYNYILSDKIQNGELLLAGSLEECEIRAATMLAGRRLAELSGKTMCDIDTYLWLKRKEIDKPFHLTITTNY
jgi:hypothetical protein